MNRFFRDVVYGFAILTLVFFLTNCSLFTPAVPSVVERMVTMAAEQALKEAEKELSEVPIKCDFEYDIPTKKMFMMCEADLSD